MSAIEILGLRPIRGGLSVQGSKNAVLPMMAASVLNRGKTVLENVPGIQDVFCMMGILDSLGCSCRLTGGRLEIDSSGLCGVRIAREEMEKMRSSVMLLGALLGRCGEAQICRPGGCRIGSRPIDLHLEALEALGARFESDGEILRATGARLAGGHIVLSYPSVGATENALFAAVMASGRTVVEGCAREPEIGELCMFLNGMGACVRGGGTGVITVEGGLPLHDVRMTVGGDRIAAGTYLLAASLSGGEIVLEGVRTYSLTAVTEALQRMGAVLYQEETLFYLRAPGRLHAARIRTGPYPEFPTDLQSAMMAAMSVAKGESVLEETVFENRLGMAKELLKMGADIVCCDRRARIRGRSRLRGARVEAGDLRGGAALAAAALGAQGRTVISGYEHIRRGYEDLCRDLRRLGAQARVLEENANEEEQRAARVCEEDALGEEQKAARVPEEDALGEERKAARVPEKDALEEA